ncbi:MAG: hypothetical protein K2X49_25645 [Acetobacteraceae bacterium]|nr:hypothetical protein [Acetobacteraceae bacterium]
MKDKGQALFVSQAARFAEVAKSVGADAGMETVRAALRAVGCHKPKGDALEPPPEPKATASRSKKS